MFLLQPPARRPRNVKKIQTYVIDVRKWLEKRKSILSADKTSATIMTT